MKRTKILYIKIVARTFGLVRVPLHISTLSNPSLTQIICNIVVLRVFENTKKTQNKIECD